MNIGKEIAILRRMTVVELRKKHAEVFGEETRSGNRDYLVKRIAWRLQSLAEGDLSERARRRAQELANDADIRMRAPRMLTAPAPERTLTAAIHVPHDNRVPLPGAVLTRDYKGKTAIVTVLPDGFEHEGKVYRSLSGVARAITGTHWNGYHFFGLLKDDKNHA
jgi:hypothetical protein